MADQDAYQRMLQWCSAQARPLAMADQKTIIEGQRTVTHMPLGAPGARERGTIDNEAFKDADWLGDNVQQVIELMDGLLGPVDPDSYQIVE
jgi:hypothetical protein